MNTLINIAVFFLLKAIWSPLAFIYLGGLVLIYTWPWLLAALVWFFED